MAKILCITSGRMAMFNATTALAERLTAAGHSVLHASPDDVRRLAESRGLEFIQLPPSRLPESGTESLAHGWRDRARRRIAAVQDLGVDELASVIERIAPDLVLIDIELHAHILTALSLSCPLGLLCTFISIRKRRGLPPLHASVVPGRGWGGSRAYAEWLWMRFRVRKALDRFRSWVATGGVDPVSILRILAEREGVSFSRHVTLWQWLIPISYKRLPILSLRAAELDFRSDPSPQLRFCGPMIEKRRTEILEAPETRERLNSLFHRRRRGDSKALIFCSLSSFVQAEPSFVRRVLAAFVEVPEWDLVLSVGGSATDEAFDPPGNVHVFRWVPQLRVLREVDAAVINAGFGISDCILQGVPMVVYSLKRNDQNGNAARVVYHGLGIAGDKDHDSAGTIRRRIQAVLTDDAMGRRIERMRRQMLRYDAHGRAAAVVGELLDEARDNVER